MGTSRASTDENNLTKRRRVLEHTSLEYIHGGHRDHDHGHRDHDHGRRRDGDIDGRDDLDRGRSTSSGRDSLRWTVCTLSSFFTGNSTITGEPNIRCQRPVPPRYCGLLPAVGGAAERASRGWRRSGLTGQGSNVYLAWEQREGGMQQGGESGRVTTL